MDYNGDSDHCGNKNCSGCLPPRGRSMKAWGPLPAPKPIKQENPKPKSDTKDLGDSKKSGDLTSKK